MSRILHILTHTHDYVRLSDNIRSQAAECQCSAAAEHFSQRLTPKVKLRSNLVLISPSLQSRRLFLLTPCHVALYPREQGWVSCGWWLLFSMCSQETACHAKAIRLRLMQEEFSLLKDQITSITPQEWAGTLVEMSEQWNVCLSWEWRCVYS